MGLEAAGADVPPLPGDYLDDLLSLFVEQQDEKRAEYEASAEVTLAMIRAARGG
jgi:hypothetical protein